MVDEEEYEKLLKGLQSSMGHSVVLSYVEEVISSDNFQSLVSEIRKKYSIPEGGFPKKIDSDSFQEHWISDKGKKYEQYEKDVDKISKKYSLPERDGRAFFNNYIFFNKKDFDFEPSGFNVCMISHVDGENEYSAEERKMQEKLFPVLIKISPYASLRAILEYIKATYNFPIKSMQEYYKEDGVKLGKFKKKKSFVQERNEFIYQNKHLPKSEIMKLVSKKFGGENIIDMAYITRIIALEKKKRKEL